MGMKSDEEELKEFLLDIKCLDKLTKWTSRFNLFDVLKISKTEIRHSNMLAWLLNPSENHGLSNNILTGFLQYAVNNSSGLDDAAVLGILLSDGYDAAVRREWQNIDVLVVSLNEKFVLCIENKIDSGEHSNQLQRYREIVEKTYPDYRRFFIYLSPDGNDPSDEMWCPMGYGDVLDIIEKGRERTKLLPEAELLVDNYVDIIRRKVVEDDKLRKICEDIYAKHQRALDLIFEYRPDQASELSELFRKWAEEKTQRGEIEVVSDKCTKKYTRFKTKTMSEILPDAPEATSAWKTKNYYFWEIVNDNGKKFFMQLSLNSTNIPDDLRKICDKINDIKPSPRQKKNGWIWRVHHKTPVCFLDEKNLVDENDFFNEEEIFNKLNEQLKNAKGFEERLKEKLSTLK